MAKPPAGFHTPRPSSLRSTSIPRCELSSGAKGALCSTTRSSAGSSSSASAADLPASRDLVSVTAKVVAKRLAYDVDELAFPAVGSTLPEEADLVPLLELPDPDSSSSTVISASPDDAMAASAHSTVTQVAAPTDSNGDSDDRPPLTEMDLVLAELRRARGLSPRSKRLIAALVEVAAAELSPTKASATARHLRRAAFWGKVRVGVLAATVFAVAAVDVALAVALLGARNGNKHYHHVLPPT